MMRHNHDHEHTDLDPAARVTLDGVLRPRACWGIAIVFALVSGLLYWAISFVLQPSQPFPVTILYRFGDTDYLDLYYAAARLRFHEFLTEGIEAPRVVPYPFGLAYVYGLPIMLFGDAGFIVGDAAVSMARIAICMLLVRPSTRTPAGGLAAAIVLFAVTGPLPGVSRVWEVFFHPLWDLRNIRPFITGLFALILVYTTWRINEQLLDARAPRSLLLLHGAAIGLTVQGDLHTGIIAAIVTACVFLFHLVRAPNLAWPIIGRGALAVLACVVVVAPMAYQVTQAHPDVVRRLGQVPLSRIAPPFILTTDPMWDIAALAIITLIILRWRIGGEQLAAARRVLGMTVFYALASVAALPLSVMVLGEGIQIYHFAFRADGFVVLGYTLAILLVVPGLLRRLAMPRLAVAGVVAIGALHLAFIGYRGVAAATTQYQQRPWDIGWTPIAGYRPGLIALWKELSGPAYAGANVLGTFDQQLGMLWAGRDEHHDWLPDPALSTVPDAAIERRLISFSQLVGMPAAAFDAHLREEYFYNHLLNSEKWQANRLYTFSDISRYDPTMRATIATRDWFTIPPNDDVQRLQDLYRRPDPIDGRLDLIVLNRGSSLGELPGPTTGYRKTYENPSFTVWLKTP